GDACMHFVRIKSSVPSDMIVGKDKQNRAYGSQWEQLSMNMDPVVAGGIGRPVRRKEDQRLVTGAGRYCSDIVLPGQLHAVIVRSPHAHARIKAIDTTQAKATPGVVDVLTGIELKADGIGDIPG